MFGFNLNFKKLELEKEIFLLEGRRKSAETELELETSLTQMKIDLSEAEIKHQKEIKTIEHKRKIADEDIKHMIKMKEEKIELQYQKKIVELEKQKAEEIAKVKDDYRDKMEEQLKTETQNVERKFESILKRLPNVNVRLKGEA